MKADPPPHIHTHLKISALEIHNRLFNSTKYLRQINFTLYLLCPPSHEDPTVLVLSPQLYAPNMHVCVANMFGYDLQNCQ